jgi:hypothetical protein
MSEDKQQKPSKSLVDARDEADKVFDALENHVRTVVETVRQHRDINNASVKFAQHADSFGGLPPDILKTEVAAMNRSVNVARMLVRSMDEPMGLFTSTLSSSANTVVAVTTATQVWGALLVENPELEAPYSEFVGSLNSVFGRADLVSKIRATMLRLGLDRVPDGRQSPVELLDEAHSLISRPMGGVESPLGAFIALRSAIDDTLDALVRRAPDQEPTKRDGKIMSLGRRCGKQGLAPAHFERLQSDFEDLHKKLTGGKQAQLPRARISLDFYSGVTFLDALLGALDETRFRPVSR